MKKDEMLQLIDMMLKDFDKILGKSFLHKPGNDAKVTLEYIKPAFVFLDKIYKEEYKALMKIYTLQEPQKWLGYELYDMTDHPEWIMLSKAKSALRKAMISRKRPDYFKSSKMKEVINGSK